MGKTNIGKGSNGGEIRTRKGVTPAGNKYKASVQKDAKGKTKHTEVERKTKLDGLGLGHVQAKTGVRKVTLPGEGSKKFSTRDSLGHSPKAREINHEKAQRKARQFRKGK